MKEYKREILMTGPNNDPSVSLGGIVTVVNMILRSGRERITYFNRDLGETAKLRAYFQKVSAFRKLLTKRNFKLVHFHFSLDRKSLFRELMYARIARRKNVEIVMHLHGGPLLFEKQNSRLVKALLLTADKIIVLSALEKRSLTTLYDIPRSKIAVLKNSIDLTEIPSFNINTGQETNGRKVIFFGRLHESKGIDDIVAACRILVKKNVGFRFEAYGNGPGKEMFLKEMNNLLKDKFSYKGVVWGVKKWEALQENDIFLLPSRYGEGLPMAMLEAMALGKVVIASGDASISDVIVHGHNGLLVPKNAPQELADILERTLTDRTLQQKLGAEARQTILSAYNSDQYGQSLSDIYSQTGQTNMYAIH